MRTYGLPHPSCKAATVTHSITHAVMPDGTLGAEVSVEVPCALTATAARAITTSSLENMKDDFFFQVEYLEKEDVKWGDFYAVRERKRGASGTILCGSYIVYEIW